ncbi:MAG TPA: MFS transporter, partial [Gammaproteobacteria bacterium]|nr:MFS transporter [Gammaproteobacteria bacterium]
LTFIPLSTMCLSSIPNHLINEASGLYSLMRVLGSSAGISIIITYFTRQTQASWNELGGFINPYNENLTQYLQALNLNPTDPLAMQILGKELSIYSQMQGMIDSYFLITFCFIVMLPLIFLFERRKIKNQPVVTLD